MLTRKLLYFFTGLMAVILLIGCSKDTTPELIINVYLEGSGDSNAISLYNITDHDVSTKDYEIQIFDRRNVDTPETIVSLGDNTIKAGDVFVVANSKSSEEVLSHTDLKDAALTFGGREHIALVKNGTRIDALGSFDPLVENDNMRAVTLVRKVDHATPTATFNQYDWILYAQDNTNYLDKFWNSVTPEELLEGPKYNEESPYYNNDFIASPNVGGGGFTEVETIRYVDGDTTVFNWKELNENVVRAHTGDTEKLGFEESARYFDVDTPESYSGNIQEFGLVAKQFTKEFQSNAKTIHCQSKIGNSLTDTYGRILCYVYADDIMVNYMLILKGYSVDGFEGMDMFYKDIPYYGYFLNARLYAKQNKLGKFGETDPYWDYANNRVQSQYA